MRAISSRRASSFSARARRRRRGPRGRPRALRRRRPGALGRLRRLARRRGDGGFGLGQFLAEPIADRVALLDLAQQSGRLGGGNRALLVQFPRTGDPCRRAAGRRRRARFPARDVAPARADIALARDGQRLVVRGELGGAPATPWRDASCLACAGTSVRGRFRGREGRAVRPCAAALRPFALAAACSARSPGGRHRVAQPRGQPFARRLGLIERAQRLRSASAAAASSRSARDQGALQRRQCSALRGCLRGFGASRPARRQFRLKLGEAVLGLEPRRFGRAFAAGDEPVPAAQRACG